MTMAQYAVLQRVLMIICCGKAVRLNLDEPLQNVVLVEAPYSSVNSLCVISSVNFEDT
jgi:hypothetical protein